MANERAGVGTVSDFVRLLGRSCVFLLVVCLLYLILKEVFWYELPRTLGGLAVGVRRLYLPSGVMNQVADTKNRVVKA